MADRCHWTREADGSTTLIPGCWSRAQNPDAECHCGQWSEDTAGALIKRAKERENRLRYEIQLLRDAIRKAGINDPTDPLPMETEQYKVLRRRQLLHRAITEAGEANA